ncbi:putative myosin light chain kinase [Gracilariopsis chorda]|uniref:Putative myosin light chain kinase n=1 Tax=Gracilariopsis chorda TaxID=448386 RepID=A0A2V3IYW7_9FLOR|nr:putative myosin light chain kinase [Gracilariopsis chorda]|eukprot:PXF47253.1 putative myosin light chain kinase [Gracilariopsis chorda]
MSSPINIKKLNDVEGWVGFRRRFFEMPPKMYLKLNGAAITVHGSPKGPIEVDLSVLGAIVIMSMFRRMITLQMQSGYKYYMHFESRQICREWAAHMRSASTRRFENDYELGEQIGEGAFATVHKGRRKSDGAVVAIKKVIKQQFDMMTYRELQREMYSMKHVKHDGIIAAYDVYNYQKEVYFILEFMEGGSVKDLMGKHGGLITEKTAASITRQVLLALAYLHDNGYAHRDIKLENILCVSGDLNKTRVCLADFGYVNFFEDERDECMKSLIGTPVYVAPEIISEKPYSAAVDLYAIGVMVYRMLCGEYPYDGEEDHDKTMALASAARLEFKQPAWRTVSLSAKSFVRGLLQPVSKKRLTARGALCHQWLAGKEEGMWNVPTLCDEQLARRKDDASAAELVSGEYSTTVVTHIANISSPSDSNAGSISPRIRGLVARFSSEQIVPCGDLPLATRPLTSEGQHQVAGKKSSGEADNPREDRDGGPPAGEERTRSQSQARYSPQELRRTLKRHVLAAIFTSRLLLTSELRRPKPVRPYHMLPDRLSLPDREVGVGNQSRERRNHRPGSPTVRFRAFSFSGFTARAAAAGESQPSSPLHRLTSRLKRTFSFSGRQRQ